jgi:hypothetical protein
MTDAASDDLRCVNCGREARPDENPDDDWRVESDGVGELLVLCPECWQREFGRSGKRDRFGEAADIAGSSS